MDIPLDEDMVIGLRRWGEDMGVDVGSFPIGSDCFAFEALTGNGADSLSVPQALADFEAWKEHKSTPPPVINEHLWEFLVYLAVPYMKDLAVVKLIVYSAEQIDSVNAHQALNPQYIKVPYDQKIETFAMGPSLCFIAQSQDMFGTGIHNGTKVLCGKPFCIGDHKLSPVLPYAVKYHGRCLVRFVHPVGDGSSKYAISGGSGCDVVEGAEIEWLALVLASHTAVEHIPIPPEVRELMERNRREYRAKERLEARSVPREERQRIADEKRALRLQKRQEKLAAKLPAGTRKRNRTKKVIVDVHLPFPGDNRT